MSGESAIVVETGAAPVLHAFGEEVTILLNGEQTGGRLTMWLETTPPGGGPPPHFHINDDETFHVLEGRVAFFQNSQWQEVGPGGSAFVPRGQLHTFASSRRWATPFWRNLRAPSTPCVVRRSVLL